jgi:hypothetical protein
MELSPGGVEEPEFDDNAVATIVWYDFNRAMSWLDTNAWLAEWQYIDYLYQSPNYDRDWRTQGNRTARISRFNVLQNTNTVTTQTRRGIFNDGNPFTLEAIGPFAGLPDVQTYLDAITELFTVLDQRAELEYNMELFIDCQGLQGTALGIPIWEEREVIQRSREPKTPPVEYTMPDGSKKLVHSLESDDYKVVEEKVKESWPCFEYRRLGTTIYDPKWRTPNRPDLSAAYRIDVDYVTMRDLQQMRKLSCYKDIPSDEELKTFFLANPRGDAPGGPQVVQDLNANTSSVLHAEGEQRNMSQDPALKPLMLIHRWSETWVYAVLVYPGGRKVIRKEKHGIGDFALGFSATWQNIDNSGYGIGIGRQNAGDQRMEQGMLNEVLKMIAFWTNAPLVYNTADGNAPTQNIVTGLGTLWGLNGNPNQDVRKIMGYLDKPTIPAESWKVMDRALYGGQNAVGANSSTMQGAPGEGATALRTAAGVDRIGGKADEQMATPIQHLEYVLERWYKFLWMMVQEVMPVTEIRRILSARYADAIVKMIDSKILLNATFNVKILAGQKLAARQAIAQLIPFLLQLIQQPQLLQYMHEKGWTINFLSIEKIFLRMSELQGADDIIVPLSPEEKQAVQQMNPNAMKAQLTQLVEKLRGANKIAAIQAQGAQDVQKTLVEKTADVAAQKLAGSTQLDLAEARLERNTDMGELQNGV